MLSENGSVGIDQAASRLSVSAATIRRDLQRLESQQLLARTHGGAVARGVLFELPLRYRGGHFQEEKRRIARAAAGRVADGSAVGLTGGTTTSAVARALAERKGLTIVTNALNIASELAVRPQLRLVVTGGVVRSEVDELAGPLAEVTLADLQLDTAFVGVEGLTVDAGLTGHDEAEVYTNRAMIRRARRVIVVTHSSKIGLVSFARVCSIEDVDELITDCGADEVAVQELRSVGLTVTTV